jgi:hypothetical protein
VNPQRVVGRSLWGRIGFLIVVALTMTGSACSSAVSSATASSAAVASTCSKLAGALSDGPDADVDPVGYALAQIKPLRAIRTTDEALEWAITKLASAYQSFYASNGSKATKAGIAVASHEVDKICPGVTS